MSIQRMINVQCDVQSCYNVTDASGWTVLEAKDIATIEGWKLRGSLAICPDCQSEGETFANVIGK